MASPAGCGPVTAANDAFRDTVVGFMNKRTVLPGLAFGLLGGLAHGDTIKTKVTVLENIPTTSSYNWQVAGYSDVYCTGTACLSNFSPAYGGSKDLRGAVLKLLLPDERIVVAECDSKPNVGIHTRPNAYRDCRMPAVNSTIDAEFNRSTVKIFIEEPSIDGSGKTKGETYQIKGVLQPTVSRPAAK